MPLKMAKKRDPVGEQDRSMDRSMEARIRTQDRSMEARTGPWIRSQDPSMEEA